MQNINSYILAIESSCDDTSCAVMLNNVLLSHVTANQSIHALHGGVIPELASRDHQKNIVMVVDQALKQANIGIDQLSAIAVTSGPGLMGSLLVGLSFAKSLALSLNLPLIEVNHMQAHILAHFIKERDEEEKEFPEFPFLCLTVSGGHTQLVSVNDYLSFELLGQTIDDAVGEAFDKAAKILGLPYPGGPLIDKYAQLGDATKYKFAETKVPNYNYSFSGIKTSFLYFIQKQLQLDPSFIQNNRNNICASYQCHLIKVLLKNVTQILSERSFKAFVIAGGVSANSELRKQVKTIESTSGIKTFIPKFEYCTDNAAMIGVTAYFKFLKSDFSDLACVPSVRVQL
ncbi:MAG: tRNA (adenosine(37)-N6)-threonylcarbamoyltransferase complex transferase subunit TsaD [Bacteroidota bacterium]